MRTDVYDKIIDVCQKSIKTMKDHKNYEALALTMISVLTGIMGVCGGAKSAETLSMSGRKVRWSDPYEVPPRKMYIATFRCWGLDAFEGGGGVGADNFSTAIIELEDGTVRNVPAETIKFIKEDDNGQ